MPNRIVREGFLDSEAINSLEAFTECIFHRLLIVSDDAGRFDGRAQIVASRCFPLRDSIRAKDVEGHLLKLEQAGLLIRYEWNGKPFLQLTKWQKAGKSLTSKFPWSDGSFSIKYAKAETRDGLKEFVTTSLPHTHPIRTPSEWGSRESNTETETETETDTDTETGTTKSSPTSNEKPKTGSHTPCEIDTPRNLQEVIDYFERNQAPAWLAEDWFNQMESAGWIVRGTQVRKWRAAAITKIRYWEEDVRPKTRKEKVNGKCIGNKQIVDRNIGTANEGAASEYAGCGIVE